MTCSPNHSLNDYYLSNFANDSWGGDDQHNKNVLTHISGFLQIRILVNILLVSGYQPRLTKSQEDVTYFSKLNLPFLPQITNEKISDMQCYICLNFIIHM